MGFWSANGDLGNIVGFMTSTLLFTILDLPWQVPLIFFALYSIATSRLLYWKVE